MIYLLLSIISSTLILVIFKYFEKYNISTFQAIVANYFVAFTVGFLFFGSDWDASAWENVDWIPFVIIVGSLFISLFLLMGKSAQANGIGTTSVAVKMSLAIPVVAAIYLYNESIYLSKVIGVILALIGVYLITYKKKNASENSSNILFLIILFVGSGLLDALLNYAEKNVLEVLSPALFSAFGFGFAALIGGGITIYQVLKKKVVIAWKNLVAGIVLGIPNFFSIYFLIMAIRQPQDDSVTYALNNVGIVLASFLVGILLFKEHLSIRKFVGLIVAIVAIVLLSW